MPLPDSAATVAGEPAGLAAAAAAAAMQGMVPEWVAAAAVGSVVELGAVELAGPG